MVDPMMHHVVSERVAKEHAASTNQLFSFGADVLTYLYNFDALTNKPGQWVV